MVVERLSAQPEARLATEAVPPVRYVCPETLGALELRDGELFSPQSGRGYRLLDTAYADFAPDCTFDDWWAERPETLRQWLATSAPREEEFQVGMAQNYTLPLLKRLGLRPGRATMLSAACGLAADVQYLNDAGYSTWGIDLGGRTMRWGTRRCRAQLARADLFKLPFPDASFDFVQCMNVIEHIGTVGDTTRVTPDYEEKRAAAIASLLRVTRPGGYVLLSGVSRRFPLDFFHLQESRLVRVHSPWEPFSLSAGDYARLADATGYAEWVKPLPLRGFFSWTHLRHRPLARPLLPIVDWMLGSMPDAFYGSALSFFTIVLVRRGKTPSDISVKAINGTANLS